MSGNGAFEDEMDFLRRTSHSDDELAAFVHAVRSTLVERPDPATAALLAPRLAETARASVPTRPVAPTVARSRPRSRRALVARVAVAVASIPLLFSGLAFAGVDLPGPADSAFEAVGIELPNQAVEVDDQPSTGPSSDESHSGEHGAKEQENAAEKRGHGKDKSNKGRDRGRGQGAQGKGRALGKRGLAPGHAKSKGSNGGSGGHGSSGKKPTPPGQANKESSPGNGGSSSGKAKGHSK